MDPSRLPLDPRIAQQYMLHQQRLRSHHHHHHPLHHHHHHMGAKPKASATVGPGMGGVGMGSGAGPLGPGPQVGSPSSTVPPQGHPQGHITAGNNSQQQVGSCSPFPCPNGWAVFLFRCFLYVSSAVIEVALSYFPL